MYKVNSCIFVKILILISLAFSQGCSDKKASNKYVTSRRAPELNPIIDSSEAKKNRDLKAQASVRRAKDEYDTYQDYQSNEAPVSLKDIKRIKRRPVLNIKELNAIMDSKSQGYHAKKTKSHTSKNTVEHSKKTCTEAHCDLKKVINYNKQQAKKTSAAVPTASEESVKYKSKTIVSAPSMPTVVMPKVIMPASSTPVEAKPIVSAPSIPTAVMPKVIVPASSTPVEAKPIVSAPSTSAMIIPERVTQDLPKVGSPSAPVANEPMSKFTESQSKNKIGTVNTLLIKFYFNIKNKIHSLFIGDD